MTKNTLFFPLLHVFASLNDVHTFIAWSWKTTRITWIFVRGWYPTSYTSAPPSSYRTRDLLEPGLSYKRFSKVWGKGIINSLFLIRLLTGTWPIGWWQHPFHQQPSTQLICHHQSVKNKVQTNLSWLLNLAPSTINVHYSSLEENSEACLCGKHWIMCNCKLPSLPLSCTDYNFYWLNEVNWGIVTCGIC